MALHHLAWAEVLTVAVRQRVHRGVANPDQAWIPGELIRYLEHPDSEALDLTELGWSWWRYAKPSPPAACGGAGPAR